MRRGCKGQRVATHKPDDSVWADCRMWLFLVLKAEDLALSGLHELSSWMATKSGTQLDKANRLLHLSCPPLFCFIKASLTNPLHSFVFHNYLCAHKIYSRFVTIAITWGHLNCRRSFSCLCLGGCVCAIYACVMQKEVCYVPKPADSEWDN